MSEGKAGDDEGEGTTTMMTTTMMMRMNVLHVVIIMWMGVYIERVLRFGGREWWKGVGEGSGG